VTDTAGEKRPDGVWDVVGRLLGENEEWCFVYSEEELASFAGRRMRRRDARVLEKHLEICPTCSAIVGAIREHIAEYQADDAGAVLAAGRRTAVAAAGMEVPASYATLVFRPSLPVRWRRALATAVATAVLLIAIVHW